MLQCILIPVKNCDLRASIDRSKRREEDAFTFGKHLKEVDGVFRAACRRRSTISAWNASLMQSNASPLTRLPTDYDYSPSRGDRPFLLSLLFLHHPLFRRFPPPAVGFLSLLLFVVSREAWRRVRPVFLDSQRESTTTAIRRVTRPVPPFSILHTRARKYRGDLAP